MKKFLCMVKKGGEQSLFSEVIEAEYAEAALQLFFGHNRAKLRAEGAPTWFGTPLRLENDIAIFKNGSWHFSAELE